MWLDTSPRTAHLALCDQEGTLTWEELWGEVEKLARKLPSAQEMKGKVVGLYASYSRSFLIGLLALLSKEAVVFPLPLRLAPREWQEIQGAVTFAGLLSLSLSSIPWKEGKVFSLSPTSVLLWSGEEDPVLQKELGGGGGAIRFTSGTTGSAKGVFLSQTTLEARTQAAIEGLKLTEHDRVTWMLPMAYHFVVSLLAYVRSGTSMIVCDEANPSAIIENTQKWEATRIYTSPTVLHLLTECSGTKEWAQSVSAVYVTSSGLSPLLAEEFFKRHRHAPQQLYGMIEIGIPLGNLSDAREVPGSVGTTLPGYQATLLNPSSYGEGSLAVRGPGLFDAYLAPYRPSSALLQDGWLSTGDIAKCDAKGRYFLQGREKSVIITGGAKVFPEEVEGILISYPGVLDAQVFGEPHHFMGELPIAKIVVKEGEDVHLGALRRFCYERLSRHKVPKEFLLVSSLNYTGSGKKRRGG